MRPQPCKKKIWEIRNITRQKLQKELYRCLDVAIGLPERLRSLPGVKTHRHQLLYRLGGRLQ